MSALPEEILRCFRADFTEHLSYEELQHLKKLKNSFVKKEKIEKISNNFMAFVKEMWQSLLKVDITKRLQISLIKLPKARLKD